MTKRAAVFLFLALFVVADAPRYGYAQDAPDESMRAFYVASRPKVRKKPKPRRTAPTTTVGAQPATHGTGAAPNAAAHGATVEPVSGEAAPLVTLGLGYTLFKRSPNGAAVRAAPKRTFATGDHLRLQLEPNIDGYLYVFYTNNGKNPTMLFPDARLDGGRNDVEAHTLAEIPSRQHPRFKWFQIVGEPAVERLFVVVARDPIPGVPVAEELVRYCQTFPSACPWKPSSELWRGIEAMAGNPLRVDTMTADVGQAQAPEEEGALSREIVLSSTDAQPTVVAISGSKDASMLVATIDIKH
jgi:hypothetical protein